MNQVQLKLFKQWFTEYVCSFYTADDDFLNQNINLKECHTHRVCKAMRDLAGALKMNQEDTLLAETIALFHDVGRFEQFKQYRTYKDTISENHSVLGLKVLQEHHILDKLSADEPAIRAGSVSGPIKAYEAHPASHHVAYAPCSERVIIEKAIEFHGALNLPALDDRTLHFARMIRDADKLDIFGLLVENYRILAEEPEKFKWELEFPDTPECNPEIIHAILNNQLVSYEKLKTINDAKLLQLGWMFDVYFSHTLKQIHDRGYLQTIINLLPKTDKIKQVTEHILVYVQNRIKMGQSTVNSYQ